MRKITIDGFEYSIIQYSATQIIVARGEHTFYDPKKSYAVLYDKPTGFVVMDEREFTRMMNECSYGVLENWS